MAKRHRLWVLRKTGIDVNTGKNEYWYHDPFTDIYQPANSRKEARMAILAFYPKAFPKGWYDYSVKDERIIQNLYFE